MKLSLLSSFNAERADRRAAALLTDVEIGTAQLFRAIDLADVAALEKAGGLEFVAAVEAGISRSLSHEGRHLFATISRPPLRIVVLGAVHISQAMVPLAKLLSLDLTVLDPRTAFASPERFPGINLIAEWPEDALPKIGLDTDTAFVALTHDPKIDDPGLTAAIAAKCFYIGALGSRKTHARRLERLAASGISEATLAGIRAPIGLDIGAKSPEEIALSIMAEIVAIRRKGAVA